MTCVSGAVGWLAATWGAAMVSAALLILAVSCGDDGPQVTALSEYSRGLELQEKGKLADADEAYQEALRLDPDLALAYAGRGFVYFARRDYPQALGYLERAIELDSQLAIAYHYRGRIHFTNDEARDALLNFTRAVQLDPNLMEAYYHRGIISRDSDDLLSAIEDFSKVIELEPDSPRFYLERAQLHLLNDDLQPARADLEYVLSLTQDEAWLLPARQLLAGIAESR